MAAERNTVGLSRVAKAQAVMATVLIGGGIFLAVWNIWLPFSFWQDELASVGEASQAIGLMVDLIVIDNHPPLYVFLLAVWMRIFGSSEVAVHVLSAIFSFGGLSYLSVWSRRLPSPMRWTLLTLHCTNVAFCYYSQEARSYSLLLAVSVVLTTTFLSDLNVPGNFRRLLISGFVCALTHYYGLVMTGIIFLYCIVDLRRQIDKVAFIALVSLFSMMWPIYHVLHANLLGRKDDFPWITSPWPLDSIGAYLGAFTPGLTLVFSKMPSLSIALSIIAFLALLSAMLYFIGLKIVGRCASDVDIFPVHRLSYLLVMGILATMSIDFASKTTVPKYLSSYIPAFEILLSYSLATWCFGSVRKNLAGMAATLIISLSSLYISFGSLASKQRSADPWKQNALLVQSITQPFPRYFLTRKVGAFPPNVFFNQTNFYLQKYKSNNRNNSNPIPIFSSEIYRIKPPFVVIYDDIEDEDIRRFDERVCKPTHCRHIKTSLPLNTTQQHGVFIVNGTM